MKYIALTIGPIVETLSLGRKTSEIWMASYLFSSFMKKVIQKLQATKDADFLVPYTKDDALFKTQDNGIGKFHDRFIFTTQNLTLKDVEKIVQEEKDALGTMMAQSIKRDEKKVQAFIAQYLQTYILQTQDSYENPIIEISKLLDSIELHTPLLETDEDYMRLFLKRDILLNSQLAKDSFGKKPSFHSIEAIAAQEDDVEDFKSKNAQKYIAIIHADGDNLGKFIKEKKDVSEVSKRLFAFDEKAVKSIKEYGAIPLFIGGDDLLLFAPVINAKKETVLDLVKKLSDDYEEALQTQKSTLSFGISITYYKYPLYEALEKSREALFGIAKKYKYKNKEKNTIAISVQKHSGQSFDFCISKEEDSYTAFDEMLYKVLGESLELPHAIHHKLLKHKMLFENIEPKQLSDTFNNIFNEDLHATKFKEGLELLKELMLNLGLEEEQQKKLFAMLSTIKLIRGDR